MLDTRVETRIRPVIRVFVSSTFSDLKSERNALQQTVFREIEHHCQRRGFQFQAIDLRWGVPSEAGLDHRTMRICFEELRRSQEISPQPNFLILLGDRYGWRPMPEEISVAEYEQLVKATANEPRSLQVLKDWYRRDDNAVPPVHVLRSRRDSPDGRDYGRVDAGKDDQPAWKDVQETLWSLINRAFLPGDLSNRFELLPTAPVRPPSIVRFQTSATEQEIWNGAFRVTDANQHVFAFVRRIANIDACVGSARPEQRLKDFVDLAPDGQRDAVAKEAQERLLRKLQDRLTSHDEFGNTNFCEVTTTAQLNLNSETNEFEVTTAHIDALCYEVKRRLIPVINRQMDDYWQEAGTEVALTTADRVVRIADRIQRELELEVAAHNRFGAERAPPDVFVGRESETRRILDYLRGDVCIPLVVYGPSGTGKTAILAHAARMAEKELGHTPIVRYLGITPNSSSVRALLTSLCLQLRRNFDVAGDVPTDFRELEQEFVELLHDHAAEPIYIFLDALDQLDDSDNGKRLSWLCYSAQVPLPSHVKLVVSCLSEASETDNSGLPFRELLQRDLVAKGVQVNELTADEASTLLFGRWLRNDPDPNAATASDARPNRTISAAQRVLVDQQICRPEAIECRRPLYLKMLYEEIRLWRAFDPLPSRMADTVPKLLHELFRRLRQADHHGPLVIPVLGYLACSRHGVAEAELLEILFADPDYKAHLDHVNEQLGHELPPGSTRIPIALWARLRYDLQPYLSERAATGAYVLAFYHRQVAEWVQRRLTHFVAPTRLRHQRLADYFIGCAHGPNLDKPWETHSVRGYSEAVFHCIRAAQFERAGALLQSFPFLFHKIRVGLLDSIWSDYGLLAESAPRDVRDRVVVWQCFFREQGYILRRGVDDGSAHKTFLQLAAEHADDSPLTLAVEDWLADDHCNWLRFQRVPRPAHIQRSASLAVLEGHSGSVEGALSLPDGRILSWSTDRTLRLWDIESGACLQVLKGHTGSISGALALPDGRILTWARDNTLRLWDDESGACLQILEGHTGRVRGALSLSDGQILSWANDDKTLRLWDAVSGACLHVLEGHKHSVDGALAFPDGRILSWSMIERTPRLWDAATGTCLHILEGHKGWFQGALSLAGGQILSWANDDKTLRLWDAVSGACLHVLEGHKHSVDGALAFPDGRILSWASDNTLRLWDLESESCLHVLEGHTDSIHGVLALPHSTILSWSDDNTLRLWDAASGTCRHILEGHKGWFQGALSLPDGRILSWADDLRDFKLKIWDAATGACLHVLEGHTDSISGALALPDGRILSWAGDETLRLWDGEGRAGLQAPDSPTDRVNGALLVPNSRLLSWSSDHTLRLWDVDGGTCLRVLNGHKRQIRGALPLPNGQILSWSVDSTLRLWDVESGGCLHILEGHTGSIDGALALPLGRILSWSRDLKPRKLGDPRLVSLDNTLRLWEVESGICVHVLDGHTGLVRGAQSLPDERILSWSNDCTLRLWDGASGTCLRILEGHERGVLGALQLSNGRILSWSVDNTLRLWDVESGECLHILEGHTGSVRGAISLPDGRILSWSVDNTLRLWDAATGICLHVLEGHSSSVDGALPWPTGRILTWTEEFLHRNIELCLWEAESGVCLEVIIESDLAVRHPEWFHAWTEAHSPKTVVSKLFAKSRKRTTYLHHKFRSAPLTSWHAESESGVICLLPDGTLIVSQVSGEVSILKLYYGRRRVTFAEAQLHLV